MDYPNYFSIPVPELLTEILIYKMSAIQQMGYLRHLGIQFISMAVHKCVGVNISAYC